MKKVRLSYYSIDILTSVEDFSFDELWEVRSTAQAGDLLVPIVSRHDLIRMKRAVGRPIDLEDIRDMERAEDFKLA